MYEVMLDGTELIIRITVGAERPTQFETESEMETESRSTSKQTRTATNKRFVEVQSDDIDLPKNKPVVMSGPYIMCCNY